MSEQMDVTKDSTGEPTSPNHIQSVAEFVKKYMGPLKKQMFLGLDYLKFVDHIFKDIVVTTIKMNHVSINK